MCDFVWVVYPSTRFIVYRMWWVKMTLLLLLTRQMSPFFAKLTPSSNSAPLEVFSYLVCATHHVAHEASQVFSFSSQLNRHQLFTPASVYLKGAVAKLQPAATVNEPWSFWTKCCRPLITKLLQKGSNFCLVSNLMHCFTWTHKVKRFVRWQSAAHVSLRAHGSLYVRGRYFDPSVLQLWRWTYKRRDFFVLLHQYKMSSFKVENVSL